MSAIDGKDVVILYLLNASRIKIGSFRLLQRLFTLTPKGCTLWIFILQMKT
jgi:hypothetical protein